MHNIKCMERQWSQNSFCFILNSLCVISNNSEFRVREYWYLTDYHLRKDNNLAWRWTCAKIWKWSTTVCGNMWPISVYFGSFFIISGFVLWSKTRKVWRDERGNQKEYIEEWQIMAKGKGQKDKQLTAKHYTENNR